NNPTHKPSKNVVEEIVKEGYLKIYVADHTADLRRSFIFYDPFTKSVLNCNGHFLRVMDDGDLEEINFHNPLKKGEYRPMIPEDVAKQFF
ncbi:hypothetical protein KY342_02810, partial [Candidatus Woesearchaeota archaeon]|nr:hypothetical protein [Candidatus Woesearchaeota archaeon]